MAHKNKTEKLFRYLSLQFWQLYISYTHYFLQFWTYCFFCFIYKSNNKYSTSCTFLGPFVVEIPKCNQFISD